MLDIRGFISIVLLYRRSLARLGLRSEMNSVESLSSAF